MLLEILSSQTYPRLKPLFPSLFFVISLNIKRSDITNILRPLGPVLPVCVNRSSNVTLESKLPSLTIKIYSIHSTEPVQTKKLIYNPKESPNSSHIQELLSYSTLTNSQRKRSSRLQQWCAPLTLIVEGTKEPCTLVSRTVIRYYL